MIDRDDLTKSPVLTPGASLVPINANTGGFRGRGYPHPGNPGRRREQGLINSPSAYSQENWPNPPNEISDVDIDANWYSPFQPVTPFGPPYTTWPRSYDYPVGENLQYVSPRFQLFEVLRMVAQGWGLLQAVIQTRIDQLMRMPWTVRPKDKPDTENRRSKEVKEFLKGSPDGENNFETWMRMVLWDLLVIDAPTVYVHRRRDGKPYEWWCLDGATIKPLIDDAGRRPRYPNPAYQQIIKGLPLVNFSDHEILYARQRPRSNLPHFGYSPVEQILMEILEGLRKQLYKNSFWTEGSMPEMLMSVPETWRPEQIATFQSFFDGMLGGNTALKSKVRFIPNGMTPFSVKNANGEALHADEDEWLARIVCFALSVSPQPFIRQMNRATAESAQQEAQQEGLHPLMHWVQNTFIGPLIEDPRFGFGYEDVEFVFEQEKQVDEVKQMTKITGYVKAGIMTINEGRNEIDLNPNDAGDELIVESAQGPMPVKETLEANRAKAQAVPDQLAQQKAQGDLQLKAGKQQMGQQQVGDQRTQEAHDMDMAQGEQQLRQGMQQGVAKIGGSPFGKGRRREVSAPIPDAAQEAQAASRIAAALAREGKRVAAEYRAGALLKARKPIDIDLGDVADALGLEQAALDAAGGLRVSVDPDAQVTDVLNQRAVDFAADQAARLVVGIRKTTRDSLRELIADGIAEGKSRDEIADQIEADFSFSPERAERIASYELNTAFNGAALIGAQEAAAEGVNLKKRWLDAPGACDVCQENAADGLIDLDDDFSSGDAAPSAHPRCRCSLAFVVADEGDIEAMAKGFNPDEPRDDRGRWMTVRGPQASDPGYYYHATSEDRANQIASGGLKTHKPWEGTDQSEWPDGKTESRNYFTSTAQNTWQFAPEDGRPVLLRVPRGDHPFKRESTGDIYSKQTVPADKIEALGEDGQWRRLKLAKAGPPDEPRDEHGRWSIDGPPFQASGYGPERVISTIREGISRGDKPELVTIAPKDFRALRATQSELKPPVDYEDYEDLDHTPLIAQYADRPVVLSGRDGNYHVADGHNRISSAVRSGSAITVYLFKEKGEVAKAGPLDEPRDQYGRWTGGTHDIPLSDIAPLEPLNRYPKTTERYRRMIRAGKSIDPIAVNRYDGPMVPGTKPYQLEDGHHRFLAHQLEGKTTIRANITYDRLDTDKLAKMSAEEIDAEAARAVQPTEGQAEAGNYRMGHVRVHGLDVTIENARGSVRSKKGKGGKPWSVTMPAHYGYIKRTEGSDGDHVDVYLGPDPESERVFVVNQVNADTGAFDEHKCLLGFPDAGAARATYLDGFSDGRGADRLGSMTEMTIDRFKEWLDGDTTDPVAKRAKVSQSDAAYVDAAPGDRYCNDCSMFLPSSQRLLSSCTAVNGAINPGGWCKFWEVRGDPAGRDAH